MYGKPVFKRREKYTMIYSIIFAVLIAITAIFVEDAVDRYSLWFSVFFHTLMTIMIFTVLSFYKIRDTYIACKKHLLWTFYLMLFSLLIYALCFFSTGLIGGSPYNTFYFAVSGFLGYSFAKNEGGAGYSHFTAIALGLLILLFALYRMLYIGELNDEFLGILSAMFASCSGFAYAVYSAKFALAGGVSSSQIISVRFYLLLFVSFFLLPPDTKDLITVESMIYMFFLALTGMALPVYFLQKGILAVGAEKNAIIVAFVPFLTLILAAAFHGSIDLRESVFVVILTITLLVPPLMSRYKRSLRAESLHSLETESDDIFDRKA